MAPIPFDYMNTGRTYNSYINIALLKLPRTINHLFNVSLVPSIGGISFKRVNSVLNL